MWIRNAYAECARFAHELVIAAHEGASITECAQLSNELAPRARTKSPSALVAGNLTQIVVKTNTTHGWYAIPCFDAYLNPAVQRLE